MYGTEGNGKGKDTYERGASAFQQKVDCYKVGITIQNPCAGYGQGHGEKESCAKCTKRCPVIPCRCLRCGKFGNGSLNPCGCQGKGKCHDRSKELIDAHTLFAEGLR